MQRVSIQVVQTLRHLIDHCFPKKGQIQHYRQDYRGLLLEVIIAAGQDAQQYLCDYHYRGLPIDADVCMDFCHVVWPCDKSVRRMYVKGLPEELVWHALRVLICMLVQHHSCQPFAAHCIKGR